MWWKSARQLSRYFSSSESVSLRPPRRALSTTATRYWTFVGSFSVGPALVFMIHSNASLVALEKSGSTAAAAAPPASPPPGGATMRAHVLAISV